MIDPATAARIQSLTKEFWDEHLTKGEFEALATGKEIGHPIADSVDERTTELIHLHFVADSAYERDASGKKRPRSMGDIWFRCGGMYHPINVKTGEADKNGQPNMVSLKKLLTSLLFDEIDSYYLLFVKFLLKQRIECVVYFVDMLDHLDHVTFDSGPGQIMLKERQFYETMKSGVPPASLPLQNKVEKLFGLMQDGERRLAINRERGLSKMKTLVEEYARRPRHIIDQSRLTLA